MSVSKIVSFGSGQTYKHTTECSFWSTKVFDKAVIDHSRLQLSPELQPATVIIVQKKKAAVGTMVEGPMLLSSLLQVCIVFLTDGKFTRETIYSREECLSGSLEASVGCDDCRRQRAKKITLDIE